uniref:Uncharacterized protein n=1 Tax=Ursus americanus TaxID=9643 RepID=A0A452QUL0_URSAM
MENSRDFGNWLKSFSTRLWEQLTHFRVLEWTDLDSLFPWEEVTPRLHYLATATCHRCDFVWVSTSPPRYFHTTSTGLARCLARMTDQQLVSSKLQTLTVTSHYL